MSNRPKRAAPNQDKKPGACAAGEHGATFDHRTGIVPSTAGLYEQVRSILEKAHGRMARSVNGDMVRAYWQIGQAIVEREQAERERADYGAHFVEGLAAQTKADGVKGFQARNLWWMRNFYLKFPKVNAVRSELSWTHYRLLLKVEKPDASAWYETEAATQNWSTREYQSPAAS